METTSDIEASVKRYILAEFLPGEDPEQLTASTPLITSGVLDSIATLKLALYLEESYGISLGPHETDADHLGTIERIASLVRAKL